MRNWEKIKNNIRDLVEMYVYEFIKSTKVRSIEVIPVMMRDRDKDTTMLHVKIFIEFEDDTIYELRGVMLINKDTSEVGSFSFHINSKSRIPSPPFKL